MSLGHLSQWVDQGKASAVEWIADGSELRPLYMLALASKHAAAAGLTVTTYVALGHAASLFQVNHHLSGLNALSIFTDKIVQVHSGQAFLLAICTSGALCCAAWAAAASRDLWFGTGRVSVIQGHLAHVPRQLSRAVTREMPVQMGWRILQSLKQAVRDERWQQVR